tara:strand:- start:384 stop:617 length:234 start_codon:yes stop_codon:yes gene_type:complete
MAKVTKTTYQFLVQHYIDADLKVGLRDKPLLRSMQIDFEQFKGYVEARKIAEQRRKESWKKFFDDTDLGFQNYREVK